MNVILIVSINEFKFTVSFPTSIKLMVIVSVDSNNALHIEHLFSCFLNNLYQCNVNKLKISASHVSIYIALH